MCWLTPSLTFHLLKQRASFHWQSTLRYLWKAFGEQIVLFISFGELISPSWKVSFRNAAQKPIISLCLLKRDIKWDWLLAEMPPLGSTDPRGLGIPGWPEIIIHEIYSEMSLSVHSGSALARQCICQDPGQSYDLIVNSKTKSIQHVTCKTVKSLELLKGQFVSLWKSSLWNLPFFGDTKDEGWEWASYRWS